MPNTSSKTPTRLPHRKFYILRLWSDDQQVSWRASLQGVGNGEWRHFPDLESLVAFLKASKADVENQPEPGKTHIRPSLKESPIQEI